MDFFLWSFRLAQSICVTCHHQGYIAVGVCCRILGETNVHPALRPSMRDDYVIRPCRVRKGMGRIVTIKRLSSLPFDNQHRGHFMPSSVNTYHHCYIITVVAVLLTTLQAPIVSLFHLYSKSCTCCKFRFSIFGINL